MRQETVQVYSCIGCMVQYGFPKGYQRIGFYGV